MLTTDQIKHLAHLEDNATPGPWTRWTDHAQLFTGVVTANTPGMLRGGTPLVDFDDIDAEPEQAMADAEFVAQLRNAAPELIEDALEGRRVACTLYDAAVAALNCIPKQAAREALATILSHERVQRYVMAQPAETATEKGD